MPSGYAASLLNDPPSGIITTNTFTGPSDVCSNTTNAPFNMGANQLDRPGQIIHTLTAGTFSTTGTPTLVIGTYYGTTVLAVNVAVTTSSTSSTFPFCVETWSKVAGNGTSGLLVTQGYLRWGTTLTAVTVTPIPGVALANVTVDTTVATLWTTKATWSASSVNNVIVVHQFLVEALN